MQVIIELFNKNKCLPGCVSELFTWMYIMECSPGCILESIYLGVYNEVSFDLDVHGPGKWIYSGPSRQSTPLQ